MSSPPNKPRRFAPLREGASFAGKGVPKLNGVVFDVDGTLWFVEKSLFNFEPVLYCCSSDCSVHFERPLFNARDFYE